MNTLQWRSKKENKEPITMLTCYDYSSARLLNETSVDALLVGDSLAMTMYGEQTTLPATIELIATHTRAVARGAPKKYIVADMPFLSYRGEKSDNIKAVLAIMQAGAHAIKLEGVAGNKEFIKHLVESGVPVMGHIGLTPQSIHQLGGFKVQGRTEQSRELLMQGAHDLQESGCFAVVLECVPSALARKITEAIEIPTIGIGAGPDADGQILVWQDLLGLNMDFKPKFVRTYLDGQSLVSQAIEHYCSDVREKKFPSVQESFE